MGLFLSSWDANLHPGWFPLPVISRLSIPGAPAFLRGLKLLFVSDVHLRRCVSDAKLAALIRLIAAQKADLLLLGGDYGEGTDQCARFFRALSHLRCPLGIFGVPGNNDDPALLEKDMRHAGAVLLKNRTVSVALPGGRLEIGGCDDYLKGAPRTEGLFSGGDYRILLSHQPVQPDCACDLMLSGHTHGGQMNFFGLTPYSVGFEHRLKQLAVRGLHRISGMNLAVCNGIGVSRIPLRFGARAEILLAEFGS